MAVQAAGGGMAYLYELAWQSPGRGGLLRACHGLDRPTAVRHVRRPPGPGGVRPRAHYRGPRVDVPDTHGLDAFATSGDPGWPPYDSRQRMTRVFDAPPAVTTYPEEISRRLWQDHTFDALPLPTA